MAKRALDFIAALLGLVILAPLFLIISILIKYGSPGPIFYRGVRIGLQGKPFRIFKFRTMQEEAESHGPSSTPADDPRITRMGRVLRRHKFDELPQLINVLNGEMSLVGPRPQVPWAVATYSEEERELLRVRPGITDYASLRFVDEGELLRGSADPDKDYLEKIHPQKVRLGLEYVRTRSLSSDFKILIQTLLTIFLEKKGSHASRLRIAKSTISPEKSNRQVPRWP